MKDKTLSPIHPGEILLEDFMKPLGLSQYHLAHEIGVTPIRISQIVNGERSITVDTAVRLARYFGTSAAVWLRLQVRYDLEVAESELSDKINCEVKYSPKLRVMCKQARFLTPRPPGRGIDFADLPVRNPVAPKCVETGVCPFRS